MSRLIKIAFFVLVSCILCAPFYAQQQPSDPSLPGNILPPTSSDAIPPANLQGTPPINEHPVDIENDPMLKEMTDLFLKDDRTNRRLELPKDGQQQPTNSTAKYHAAELLLRAARILESDNSSPETQNRVQQLRTLAVEVLTN